MAEPVVETVELGVTVPVDLLPRLHAALRGVYGANLPVDTSDEDVVAHVMQDWFAETLAQWESRAAVEGVEQQISEIRTKGANAANKAAEKARKDAERIVRKPRPKTRMSISKKS